MKLYFMNNLSYIAFLRFALQNSMKPNGQIETLSDPVEVIIV